MIPRKKPLHRGKRPNRARKTSAGKMTREADRLFALAIKNRDGWRCVIFGCIRDGVQTAHHISRRYRQVRWDMENASALCAGHHVYYTHRPLEWDAWCEVQHGAEAWCEMKRKALTPGKVDMEAILARLRG